MEVSGGVVCETAKVTDSDGTGYALVGMKKSAVASKFLFKGVTLERTNRRKLEGTSYELCKVGVSKGGIRWEG